VDALLNVAEKPEEWMALWDKENIPSATLQLIVNTGPYWQDISDPIEIQKNIQNWKLHTLSPSFPCVMLHRKEVVQSILDRLAR
jgi:hypothetical protein